MFTAQDVFKKAGILLNDTGEYGQRRWPLIELCGWLNDALKAIVLQKPSATATTVSLPLVKGTLQSIPEGYVSILRPVRNLRTDKSDRQPRRTISIVSEEQLNTINPAWHDEYSIRYNQQAKHLIFDEVNPRAFYVYPGNDGAGAIEVVLCKDPGLIVPISELDPESLEAYAVNVPLEDIYSGIVLDYVIYRARSKDAQEAGNAQRAALHYQQFANALGIKISVEANTSPNAKTGVPYGSAGVVQNG